VKIAYFSDTYLPQINGITYSIRGFSQILSKKHKVRIFAPSYSLKSGLDREGEVAIERYASFPVVGYKDLHMVAPNFIRMVKAVREFDPDVIHYHTPGLMGVAAILFANRMHKPLVSTYHTLFSETVVYISPSLLLKRLNLVYNRSLGSLQHKVEDKAILSSVFANLDFLKTKDPVYKVGTEQMSESEMKKFVWYAVNGIYKNSDVIVAPAESIKKELTDRKIGVPVEVISNGLDLTKFPAKEEYMVSKKILHVGRISFEKNVDIILRAFSLVNQKHSDAHLTIVGDGPALENLKMLATSLKIERHVDFRGWVTREQLGEIYRDSNVFVTASTMETQGLVILEAMSSGLPIVGVDKFAIPDLVKHAYNGYLAKPFNEVEIANYIDEIFNNHELEKQYGLNSLKAVKEHELYSNVHKMEQLYEKLIYERRH
jgi:1,2-diacylglycerol 3-alpha-glucosyltransferase